MIKDIFSTRMIEIEDVFDKKTIDYLFSVIEQESKMISNKRGNEEKNESEHPITNFFNRQESILPHNHIDELINEKLKTMNYEWKSYEPYWFADYGIHQWHHPHTHDAAEIHPEPGIGYYYSVVIYLDSDGTTSFLSPNSTSFDVPVYPHYSKRNSLIFFPSNIFHYSTPPKIRRRIFSSNGYLRTI